jgi:hypothetical protein
VHNIRGDTKFRAIIVTKFREIIATKFREIIITKFLEIFVTKFREIKFNFVLISRNKKNLLTFSPQCIYDV